MDHSAFADLWSISVFPSAGPTEFMCTWPWNHGTPSVSPMLTSLGRQIPVDSCEVLLFFKTSCGWDSNNPSLGKRPWLLVQVVREPRVILCVQLGVSQNILSQPFLRDTARQGLVYIPSLEMS